MAESNNGDFSDNSTLQEYINFGLVNNPELQARYSEWNAAVQKDSDAGFLPDPSITFGYFINKIETKVGPQQGRIGLRQQIPWPGNLRIQSDMARLTASTAQAVFEQNKRRTIAAIKEYYWEYWNLHRETQIVEEMKELVVSLEEIIRGRYITGSVSYAAVMHAQVESEILDDRLQTLQNRRITVSSRLSSVLGIRDRSILPWPDNARPDTGFAVSPLKDGMEVTLETNPRFLEASIRAERDRRLIDLANTASYPNIALGLEYVFTGDPVDSSPEDAGKDAILATLSFSLPVNGILRGIGIEESKARYRAGVQSKRAVALILDKELREIDFRLRDASRKRRLYMDELLPLARRSLAVTRNAFETGEIRFSDLISAERTVLDFEIKYIRAITDIQVARAHLEMLTGTYTESIPSMQETQIHGDGTPSNDLQPSRGGN